MGCTPPDTATVVRLQQGELLTTDSPYAEGKEHIGGFWLMEAPDLDTALEWGGRVTWVTTPPIEGRPFRARRAV